MKKIKYKYILLIGFSSTLIFEFIPSGIYKNWFIGTSIIYPYDKSYGDKAGKPAVSLQHYVNDVSNYLHTFLIYLFLYLNFKKDKAFTGGLLILFLISLLNYIYNYHKPIILDFDTNYFILAYMLIILTYQRFSKNDK